MKNIIIYAWRNFWRLAMNPRRVIHCCRRAREIQQRGGLRVLMIFILTKLSLVKAGLREQPLYEQWFLRYQTAAGRNKILTNTHTFSYQPKISIVMPTYKSEIKYLTQAIDSVCKQLYPNWELCIADDGSNSLQLRQLLDDYVAKNQRIKVIYNERNQGIAHTSNAALALTTGEFITFLDHDDLLSEQALYLVVEAINRKHHAAIIYSDEDKVDTKNRHYEPYFKPDWNPLLFYSINYLNHLTVIRSDLIKKVHGFRFGFDGAQDYDLFLRVIEQVSPAEIIHLPFILYHWRAIPGSTALDGGAKPHITENSLRALQESINRQGIQGKAVALPNNPYRFRIIFALPENPPKVSIIIPIRDKVNLLMQIVGGLKHHTEYSNWELIIVDNGSEEVVTHRYLTEIVEDKRISVLLLNEPFNWARLNNKAAAKAKGELLLLLNNDIYPINPDWLGEMVAQCLRKNIGAVGAKLNYPNHTIQHAGVVLGVGGVADHIMRNFPADSGGYMGQLQSHQNFSAVTGACLLTPKKVFDEMGGINEELAVAFNDIDYCIQVIQAGYEITWTPFAELFHYESVSRGSDLDKKNIKRFEAENDYMKRKYSAILAADPFYNLNFSLDVPHTLSFPPRTTHCHDQ